MRGLGFFRLESQIPCRRRTLRAMTKPGMLRAYLSPFKGHPSAAAAIAGVRLLGPDQLGLPQRVCCDAVDFDLSTVRYRFGAKAVLLRCRDDRVDVEVVDHDPRERERRAWGVGSAPLVYFGAQVPFAWDPGLYADMAIGSELVRVTLSEPNIVFIDFSGRDGGLCLMHSAARIEPDGAALLFWSPDED